MFERIDLYNGEYNKYFIANLYYDKETEKWRVDLQLGKGNKLSVYATDVIELKKNLLEIIQALQQFEGTIEWYEKFIKKKEEKKNSP